MTIPDIAGEAESLIRALRGVAHARIHATEAGIESVHVTAHDAEAAAHMAAHVRSALLAGLAAPVLPGRIHVRVANDNGTPATSTPPDPTDAGFQSAPRDRIRLLHDDGTRAPAPATTAKEPTDELADDAVARHDAMVIARADVMGTSPVVDRPRLVAVDADRKGDGRVTCRVAVAFQTRVHRSEAVAVDLPGAAAQAAAQATVRALLDAGIPGLELTGLREVEIAGRDYVLVALRRSEPYPRNRSGSAPIIGSPERSAAEATVAAAHEMT